MSENIYSSPSSEVANESVEPVEMSTQDVLFSFKGRINRKTYWLSMLGVYILFFAIVFGLALAGLSESLLGIVIVILYVPAIWSMLAIQAKRWHDRDKSGWYICVTFIPIIGPIWAFIENGCLAGEPVGNRFGPPQA